MSAKYNKDDGYMISRTLKIHPAQEKLILKLFDSQCDVDVEDAKTKKRQMRVLLRLAFIRLFIFPVEWALTRLLVGKKYAEVVANSGSICYNFIKGKTDMDEFIRSVK